MILLLRIRLTFVGRISALIVWTRIRVRGRRRGGIGDAIAGPVISIIAGFLPARKRVERDPDL